LEHAVEPPCGKSPLWRARGHTAIACHERGGADEVSRLPLALQDAVECCRAAAPQTGFEFGRRGAEPGAAVQVPDLRTVARVVVTGYVRLPRCFGIEHLRNLRVAFCPQGFRPVDNQLPTDHTRSSLYSFSAMSSSMRTSPSVLTHATSSATSFRASSRPMP